MSDIVYILVKNWEYRERHEDILGVFRNKKDAKSLAESDAGIVLDVKEYGGHKKHIKWKDDTLSFHYDDVYYDYIIYESKVQ